MVHKTDCEETNSQMANINSTLKFVHKSVQPIRCSDNWALVLSSLQLAASIERVKNVDYHTEYLINDLYEYHRELPPHISFGCSSAGVRSKQCQLMRYKRHVPTLKVTETATINS